jgi:hypothetical protein
LNPEAADLWRRAIRSLPSARLLAEPHPDRSASTGSDLDVAAWLDDVDELGLRGRLPQDLGLLVLDRAPLEWAGRVAMSVILLLDADPRPASPGRRRHARSTPTSATASSRRAVTSPSPVVVVPSRGAAGDRGVARANLAQAASEERCHGWRRP